jgi:hypothetical protein
VPPQSSPSLADDRWSVLQLTRMTPNRTWRDLLDHLVGALNERRRHYDAELACDLQIDGQFDLGRLLDRNLIRRVPRSTLPIMRPSWRKVATRLGP